MIAPRKTSRSRIRGCSHKVVGHVLYDRGSLDLRHGVVVHGGLGVGHSSLGYIVLAHGRLR